jgi:hypothetical protein
MYVVRVAAVGRHYHKHAMVVVLIPPTRQPSMAPSKQPSVSPSKAPIPSNMRWTFISCCSLRLRELVSEYSQIATTGMFVSTTDDIVTGLAASLENAYRGQEDVRARIFNTLMNVHTTVEEKNAQYMLLLDESRKRDRALVRAGVNLNTAQRRVTRKRASPTSSPETDTISPTRF